MGNKKKQVHTVLVRVKVFADTREEAEKHVTQYMNNGSVDSINHDSTTFNAIKHWQIKK